jgi:hypothetical protein
LTSAALDVAVRDAVTVMMPKKKQRNGPTTAACAIVLGTVVLSHAAVSTHAVTAAVLSGGKLCIAKIKTKHRTKKNTKQNTKTFLLAVKKLK